jgi:hypothetical protein
MTVLGSISTLKDIYLDLGYSTVPEVTLSRLLPRLSGIQTMGISTDYDSSTETPKRLVQDLVAGLRDHPCIQLVVNRRIQTVQLVLNRVDFPAILPAMDHLPSLQKVKFVRTNMKRNAQGRTVAGLLAISSAIDVKLSCYRAVRRLLERFKRISI